MLFKGGHIYQHNIFHVNYTTYDLNHGQDSFNPNNDHCDIMMLAGGEEELEAVSNCFCYAHVIGIYHTNVQYIGLGLKDYNTCQLDFLHVGWFELVPPDAQGDKVLLDMLRFVPMNTEDLDIFDFVDSTEVLKGCHLIPAFAKGQLHPDGTLLSPLSKDSGDWRYYYINK